MHIFFSLINTTFIIVERFIHVIPQRCNLLIFIVPELYTVAFLNSLLVFIVSYIVYVEPFPFVQTSPSVLHQETVLRCLCFVVSTIEMKERYFSFPQSGKPHVLSLGSKV